MDKDEAEKTLRIIRAVIQSTHEDLVAHNWGLIWIVHSLTNAAAFAAAATSFAFDASAISFSSFCFRL